MAYMKFNGIGISAKVAATPIHDSENLKFTKFFPEDQEKDVVEKVSIYDRLLALICCKGGIGTNFFIDGGYTAKECSIG
ncbi:MAG: hypothetical protein PHX08_03870 [Lachnospiraceae bacterium]|nr:hypothetical protein [Lachnospiraceae bacterium]